MDEQLQQEFVAWLAQKTGAKDQAQLQQVVKQMGERGVQQAMQEFMTERQGPQAVPAPTQTPAIQKNGGTINYLNKLKNYGK